MGLTQILRIAGVACLGAGVWLLCEGALTLRQWRMVPERVVTLADARMKDAIVTSDHRMSSLEQRLDNQLTALRSDLRATSKEYLQVASQKADVAMDLADSRAGQAVQALNERATDVTVPLADTLREYQRVPAVVGERLDPWTNCNGNGACWQAQFTASLGSARYTMGQIARAAPTITESVKLSTLAAQQTAQSAAITAQNAAQITKPGPAWMRWLGTGLTVAVPASQIAVPIVIQNLKAKGMPQ